MQENAPFDLIVIGSGPGGYTAAIRASQLGLRTAIVEKRAALGGTCLNVGCIPAKALLDTTELYATIRDRAGQNGILLDNLRFDFVSIMKKKQAAVDQHTRGVEVLMRENRIIVVHGSASLSSPGNVAVRDEGGRETSLEGRAVLLATGSVPAALPSLPFNGKTIITSDEALSLDAVPERLVIVGAGAVGIELGCIWTRLGSRVTVVEMKDGILPGFDRQACRLLTRILKSQGMELSVSTAVTGYTERKGAVEVSGTNEKGDEIAFVGNRVLVATGRRANLDGLGLDRLNVEVTDAGKVRVNERYETAVPGVFAIGDIIDGPMLAHKAGEEGIAVAELIAGRPGHVNYETIPNVVYTWPELASVGMTDETCTARGVPFRSGIFYFRANGRATAADSKEGFVKIVAHKETDRVLGCTILGPWASDLIHEIVTVMEFGGSAEDIARTAHAHPTFSEVVKEAAMDVEGRAVNAVTVRKG